MRRIGQGALLALSITVQLLSTGCLGFESGFSHDLGSSDAASAFGSLPSGAGGVPGLGGTSRDGLAADVATVHNPEPASLALFGGGALGVAWFRKRRSSRTKSRSTVPHP
ncbi:MAG: PEP-CTERM sorting domain-containing protein [Candidatus Omnitrophica bacterium]|nr:PEP-CTERM sorting domain-containing protein [Candidatus Omnitrophota bacterium]